MSGWFVKLVMSVALVIGLLLPLRAAEQASVIVVAGAGGNDDYAGLFTDWAADWASAARIAQAKLTTIGSGKQDSVEKLAAALAEEAKEGAEPLWLVLLGHGTATGGDAKFNLLGDDVPASRVVEWLKPFKRPVIVVCGFSTSGAWLKPLAAPGRIVVSATRSGSEINFARFGGYLATAISDADADLDQDGQTSLLEAYIAASRKTAAWYAQEGRLATEHALLDDNGDGAGTPADWFSGVRAVKKPREGQADGARAHQVHLLKSKEEKALSVDARKRRDALEGDLAKLREEKASLAEEEYLQRLEKVLVELAKVYRGGGEKSEAEIRSQESEIRNQNHGREIKGGAFEVRRAASWSGDAVGI
jgi:hypothetical protein